MSTETTEYRDALQTLLDHQDHLGVPTPIAKAIQVTLGEDWTEAEKLWAELRPPEGRSTNHYRSASGWDLTAVPGSDLDRWLKMVDSGYRLVQATSGQ